MKQRVFALGFFDGVHLGHQTLLDACVRLAAELDVQPAAITFLAHPQSLFTDMPPKLLTTHEDRVDLLRQFGIGPVYSYPVTREVMGMPWENFLEELLEFGAAGLFCRSGRSDRARYRCRCLAGAPQYPVGICPFAGSAGRKNGSCAGKRHSGHSKKILIFLAQCPVDFPRALCFCLASLRIVSCRGAFFGV